MSTSKPSRSHDILGTSITQEDIVLNCYKLPTKEQVLRAYLAEFMVKRENCGVPTRQEAAVKVSSKIKEIYERAHIPTVTDSGLKFLMDKLYQSYRDIAKVKKTNKLRDDKIKKWREMIKEIFPAWGDISSIFEEDAIFLEDQKGARLMRMGVKDTTLDKKLKRKYQCDISEQSRREREENRKLAENCLVELEDSASADDNSDTSFTTLGATHAPKRKHRKTKTDQTIVVSPQILKHPKLVECFVRNNIPPTAAAATLNAFIEASGGDSSKVNISYSTSHRYRVLATQKMSEKIKDSWQPSKISVIHWDEKLMNTLDNKNIKEERLPVLISGEGQTKLLGVSKLPLHSTDSQGTIISTAVCGLLDDWSVDKNCIKFMSFDTTSANTGHLTAACVKLQKDTGKAMLWAACRHHVGEIILTHVWDCLEVEVSKSPEVTVFQRFRTMYGSLSSADLDDLVYPELEFTDIIDKVEISSILKVASESKMTRDDYQELITLTQLLVTKDTSKFTFMKPGALHKARWMSKLLYTIKMVLLSGKIVAELPPGAVFDITNMKKRRGKKNMESQIDKMTRFCKFVVAVYIPWWVTCGSATDAAPNDLLLLKSIASYNNIDSKVAEAAFIAFQRHLWYLNQEMLPLCIFSPHLPQSIKFSVADTIKRTKKLNKFTKRVGEGFGKPTCPEVSISTILSFELKDFVGPDSWKFFEIAGVDRSFLEEPVENWNNLDSYKDAALKLQKLQVKNDAAERGVKLGHEFLERAKLEKNYQNILQVAENNRKLNPNKRYKKSQTNDNWFLTW